MQGQAVDESTHPQKQPYPLKTFHYNVSLPQKPIMKVHVLSDDMINYVTNHLQQFCNADSTVKKAHNDDIRDNVTHNYNDFEYFDDFGDYKG